MPGSKPSIQPDRLYSAALLAATGGTLDATVYVLHGHVFANAMSGNVILLGITVFSRDWMQALRHVVPLIAFVVGVVASRFFRLLPQFYASTAVLALEMIVLFIAGLLPMSFPEMAFTATISFTSAVQVSTFRQMDRLPYSSTFITGNLRTATEALVSYFLVSDASDRAEEAANARKLFLVCLCFLIGALIGAAASPALANRTLWLAEPLLLIVMAQILFSRPKDIQTL